jgi:hypothetical protein
VQQPAQHEERQDQPGDPGRDHDDLIGHFELAVVAAAEEGRELFRQ